MDFQNTNNAVLETIMKRAEQLFLKDVKNGLYDEGEPLHIYKSFKFGMLPPNIGQAYVTEAQKGF